jgi:hypothetical protein
LARLFLTPAIDHTLVLSMGSKGRYRHPFTKVAESGWYAWDDVGNYEKEDPRTLVELRMCALSAAIREKPQWYTKFRDIKIQENWRMEIEQQQRGLHDSLKLTPNMVRVVLVFAMPTTQSKIQIDYVMEELEAYAKLRDDETGIEASYDVASEMAD